MNPCRCRRGRLWCWADWVLGCRNAQVCAKHEQTINLGRLRRAFGWWDR